MAVLEFALQNQVGWSSRGVVVVAVLLCAEPSHQVINVTILFGCQARTNLWASAVVFFFFFFFLIMRSLLLQFVSPHLPFRPPVLDLVFLPTHGSA